MVLQLASGSKWQVLEVENLSCSMGGALPGERNWREVEDGVGNLHPALTSKENYKKTMNNSGLTFDGYQGNHGSVGANGERHWEEAHLDNE